MSRRRTSLHRRAMITLALLLVGVVAITGCNPIAARRTSHKTPSSSSKATQGQSGTGTKFSILTDNGREQYRIKVTALYRSGPFTRLGFTLTCKTGSGEDAYHQCAAWDDFGGGTFNTYGGFYLVDSVRHKEYLPVQSGSNPFTSQAPHIAQNKTDKGWVVFPATEKASKSLDVMVPGGLVLEDVPVGRPKPETQRAAVEDEFDKPRDTTDTAGLDLPVRDLLLHTTSEGTDEKQSKDRKDVTLRSDVLFAFGKAELTSKAKTILNRVAGKMGQDATGTVGVTGYTDSKGTPKVNNPLSKNRAKAVADYLEPRIHRDLAYSVTGKGEAHPIAPNTKDDGSDNPRGRAKNRRVTVSYKVASPKKHASSNPSTSPTQDRPAAPKPKTWTTSATRNHGDDTYRLAVRGVRRRGDIAVLRFRLTCTQPGKASSCWTLDALQGSAANYDKQGGDNRAGGFSLYRPSTKTRHYPLIDTDHESLTADVPDTLGKSVTDDYWVYFPAPDPGVTAVDVQLPQGGPTVHDVPVA